MQIQDRSRGEIAIANMSQRVRQLTHDHPLNGWEYLIHHIEVVNGKEEIHHCMVYDHVANMFQQEHMVVKNGRASIGGKQIENGVFHVIIGLEPTQEIAWTDEHATEKGIKPKSMVPGMTYTSKAKEW